MENVVDLFTGRPIPASQESDFVMEFTEGPLGDFLYAVEGLLEATDEQTFRDFMSEIRTLVKEWPV
jgi:hypothetical protein